MERLYRHVRHGGPVQGRIGVTGVLHGLSGAVDPYAAAGSSPANVADFANDFYRLGGASSDFASMFSLSRTSTAYYRNSSGVWVAASSGVARTGHHHWNGSSWVNRGILIEPSARTNLLLNSASLSTQSVTTTATTYTLHFTGTGTVTLSGTSTAGPLVGTGTGEQNRVSLTFTATAGTLTLTVSGTVSNAQLEANGVPTSYIPTTGTAVTRAADVLTMAGGDVAYSASGMSFQFDGLMSFSDDANANQGYFFRWNSATDALRLRLSTLGANTGLIFTERVTPTDGTDVVTLAAAQYTPGKDVAFNVGSHYSATDTNLAKDGVVGTKDTSASVMPDLSATTFQIMHLGQSFTLSKFRQWAVDLGDAGMIEATT